MPGWTLVDTHPIRGRTFQRPLDVWEHGFLWDGWFNGTADNIQHLELRLVNGSRDAALFSEANVARAWLSTKRRYPLAGAAVEGGLLGGAGETTVQPNGNPKDNRFPSDPHFVVREHDLALLRPQEIVFERVASAAEAQRRATALLDGPRPLSDALLVQLYVLRETERVDTVLHVLVLAAHCVTDGVANGTLVRCLLDTLARGGGSSEREPGELAQMPLEERLGMVAPSMERQRALSPSPARRRWRQAGGLVIFHLRMAKMQGGHTLPCRLTRSTPYIAARSGRISTLLTHAQSAAVTANCRLHNITFGNAFLPLAQVAMTRVLYRRYLRGEISEEEWVYRKRQPHISGGPLNLRPYLNETWFEGGGGGEFMLSIGLFYHHLPFMTVGHRKHDSRRVPSDAVLPFWELLTFDRFLHRAVLVKEQATALFNHPLFFEIVRAGGLARLECARLGALKWIEHVKAADGDGTCSSEDAVDSEVLEGKDMPVVWAHGGSSIGNMDLICPSEYPLPPTHPLSPGSSVPHAVRTGYVTLRPPSSAFMSTAEAPKIMVEDFTLRLHTRPAELYLGASSLRGKLNLFVFYDRNVYGGAVVEEWLDEVRGAVLWYLSRTHQSSWEKIGGKKGGADGLAAKL